MLTRHLPLFCAFLTLLLPAAASADPDVWAHDSTGVLATVDVQSGDVTVI